MRRLTLTAALLAVSCGGEPPARESAIEECTEVDNGAENAECPPDPCLAACTDDERFSCCLDSYGGLPVDSPEQALCLAQTYELPFGIGTCFAEQDLYGRWKVDSLLTYDCSISHGDGVFLLIDDQDGSLAGNGWFTLSLACR